MCAVNPSSWILARPLDQDSRGGRLGLWDQVSSPDHLKMIAVYHTGLVHVNTPVPYWTLSGTNRQCIQLSSGRLEFCDP